MDSDPWRRVIVIAAFVLSFIMDGIRFSFGLIYKELLTNFQKGKGATAGIGSLMFATLNFTGAGGACMYVTVSVSILQYFDKKKSFANGIAMCGAGIGGFVFNPLMNLLFETYAWRGALLIMSGITLQGVVAGMLMRPAVGTAMKEDTKQLNAASSHESPQEKTLDTKSIIAQDCQLLDVRGCQLVTESGCYSKETSKSSYDCDTNEKTHTLMPQHIENTEHRRRNMYDLYEYSDFTFLVLQQQQNLGFCCTLVVMILGSNHAQQQTQMKRPLFVWSLLKNQMFIWFMVNQFFLAMGYMVPFTYLPEIITSYGYSQKQAVWVMSIMSIVNSISRVASGWLADRKWINRRVLFCVAYFVAACAITSLYLWRSYWLLMFTCIVFSVSAGYIVATLAIIVSDLFGPKLLSDAYGLSIFARGPGNLIGSPFSGWIVDESGQLQLIFIVSGLALAFAGVSAIFSVRCKNQSLH